MPLPTRVPRRLPLARATLPPAPPDSAPTDSLPARTTLPSTVNDGVAAPNWPSRVVCKLPPLTLIAVDASTASALRVSVPAVTVVAPL